MKPINLISRRARMEPRDSLTGLLSRRSFDPMIGSALAGYAEGGRIVAVIIADLDRFKLVNDLFGHYAGDEVLRSVALALQKAAGDEALVCRYGGDEFVVLCTDTTVVQAQELATRIEAEIGSLLVNWEGQEIGPMSTSTGLAYCPRDGRRTEDLIRAADAAMFRKKGGDDDPPTAPVAVAMPVPKPRPRTDARARMRDNNS